MVDYSKLRDLRIKLNQIAEIIIIKLKDRSRFPQNLAVYRPGGVKLKESKKISFLEFALEGLENYHARLGRFEYPDQTPMVLTQATSKAVRKVPEPVISKVAINIKKNLLSFYPKLIKKLCRKGEDKTTFGETVYCDADLLELLNERINLGRFVAESKLRRDPNIYEVIDDRDALVKCLRNFKREKEVIAQAMKAAARYDLNQKLVGEFFKWIIDETTKVEVAYLQKKFAAA